MWPAQTSAAAVLITPRGGAQPSFESFDTPTVPPAPGFFNGCDENELESPRTRTMRLPDELSVAGVPLAHAEDEPLLDDAMQAALAEMVDDAAVQRADELLGAELDEAARWLRALFPHEDYLHVARSFGVRVLSGLNEPLR